MFAEWPVGGSVSRRRCVVEGYFGERRPVKDFSSALSAPDAD
jgi:hypothetical protein